jgi:hypothetical protein
VVRQIRFFFHGPDVIGLSRAKLNQRSLRHSG